MLKIKFKKNTINQCESNSIYLHEGLSSFWEQQLALQRKLSSKHDFINSLDRVSNPDPEKRAKLDPEKKYCTVLKSKTAQKLSRKAFTTKYST
jgi:hypothetical protein